MLYTDSGEYPLMDVRSIAFETNPSEIEADDRDRRRDWRQAKGLAELTHKERLQPSLLDRLTDLEPEKTQESREQRVFALTRLRESVLRDLAWLLNTTNLAAAQDLGRYPQVASSVLNFGMPDLSGTSVAGTDSATLERALRQAIVDFEPRILRHTLKCSVGDQRGPDEPQRDDLPDRGGAVGPAGTVAALSQDRDRPRGGRRQGHRTNRLGARAMDPRLLDYYNRELRFIREMGGEFAREFPKIAGRLGLESFECADPYVERLLEGFAFLAARVQLKIDAEFPAFTQHLLEMVYPHYLAPTPSMAVVELQPDLEEGSLADGFDVPRETVLRSSLGKGEQAPCEYRTAHAIRLWPMELPEAEYFSHTGPVAKTDLALLKRSKAGIRLRLRTTANLTFAQLAPGRPDRFRLVLFLQGADQLPSELYAHLLRDTVGVLVQPTARPVPWIETLPASALSPLGFAEDEALLPYAPASFQGYRNLHEYFAFPQRLLFVAIDGLGPALARVAAPEVDLILLLGQHAPALQGVLDAANFALHCTPAINLFPKRFDRIHLNDAGPEYHVVPDRTRPMDFEVYRVDRVTGFGAGSTDAREFRPFYAPANLSPGESNRPTTASCGFRGASRHASSARGCAPAMWAARSS